jgi:ElaB/YqjD/DUF883 family membrane-anchored ribosome-binding protein
LKTRKPFSRARKRLREIERIISRRHHGAVPETDDADVYLEPVVNCFHVIAASRNRSVSVDDIMKLFWFWCERWAPDVSSSQATELARHERACSPKLLADDVVGNALRLSYADRLLDNITTIGSFDADRNMRTKLAENRRRERNRLNAVEKRRANGAMPRAVYEANSLSRTKPWEAEGISRSTYDRRRKKAAAQAGAGDESASPHQTAEVDQSASPHLSSIDRRRTLVTEQSPVSERGAPQAPPPPHRPIVTRLDAVPDDGLILDEDGHEFTPPPPYQRRPAPKTWMDAAFEGYNGGRS